MSKYVIIGGAVAGLPAATRLRRLDEQAEIIVIDERSQVSLAPCGLPYYLGGEVSSEDRLILTDEEALHEKYDLDVRTETKALAIDPAAKQVRVRNKENQEEIISYDKLLLATGMKNDIPPFVDMNQKGIFTLRHMADAQKIKTFISTENPQTATVIGGGLLGLEVVENLQKLGLTCSLIEAEAQLLQGVLDSDMAKVVANEVHDQKVSLHLNKTVTALDANGQLTLSDDQSLQTDMAIFVTGENPCSDLAEKAGINLDEAGHILVNEQLQTNHPDIYAAGDIAHIQGQAMGISAARANKMGRFAGEQMAGYDQNRYHSAPQTSILRVFDLSVALIGETESNLKAKGLTYGEDYLMAITHEKTIAGFFPGAVPIAVKVLFEKSTGKLLGGQIIGYDGVDKRADALATALYFNGNIKDLTHINYSYAPPYNAVRDPLNIIGYIGENLLAEFTHPLRAEDVDLANDEIQLLDIRETPEYQVSHLDDVTFIPLSELRQRLDELNKNVTYVPFCAEGLRGYLAERILAQSGFKAKNLLGGYKTYQDIARTLTPHQQHVNMKKEEKTMAADHQSTQEKAKVITLDACGLSCPGPIVEVAKKMNGMNTGERLFVRATDPGFTKDIASWCDNTGHQLLRQGKDGKIWYAILQKGSGDTASDGKQETTAKKEKTMIVFSGDLDKAIASFIIANGAAAMGNQVNMFFTFWGLNVLRKPRKMRMKKDAFARMFSSMMPRGSKKLGLSKMNMGGAGAKMIRMVMKKHNVPTLESMIQQALDAGVKITACQMSMDLMGISQEELIDGVEIGGVATMLHDNDQSNMNLFI